MIKIIITKFEQSVCQNIFCGKNKLGFVNVGSLFIAHFISRRVGGGSSPEERNRERNGRDLGFLKVSVEVESGKMATLLLFYSINGIRQ